MNKDLEKAQAVNRAVGQFMKANPGASREQARAALGLPPKGGKKGKKGGTKGAAMVVWQQPPTPARAGKPQVIYMEKPKAAPRRRSANSGESIVPDNSGDGVTTRAGARLHANYGGHVVVQFDGPALGSTLGGFFRQLQYGGTATLPQWFPELYPQQAQANQQLRQYAQERAIGAEMAKMLGAALRAYGITPEMWGSWYVDSLAAAPPLPPAAPLMGQVQNNGQQQQLGGFGSPLGAPSMVTDEFGNAR